MAADDRTRWNKRWQGASATIAAPTWFSLVEDILPAQGKAIDVAGGLSGDGRALANHGLTTTVVDISDVALARVAADGATREASAAPLRTVQLDLESEAFPVGPWDVIGVANYLNRPLFAAMFEALAKGGLLAAIIATTTNLERHDRPSRRFLVEPGELRELADHPQITVELFSEAWRANQRHEAHLVARRM